MFATLIVALFLAVITVAIHVSGFTMMFKLVFRLGEDPPTRGLPIAMKVMRMALFLIFVHASEIWAWALFYRLAHCFPNVESAFYFSGSTYTSVGYGDVLLPARWRVLGPIESLIGILMCGLSASVFFALVSRIVKARLDLERIQHRPVHY